MVSSFNSIKKEIFGILKKSPLVFEITHANLTLKWLLKLKPNADIALQIAALSHDIERAVTGITEKDLKDYSKISEFKKKHSIRSAEIILGLLERHGFSEAITKKVFLLVKDHEFGNSKESKILMEADSLAYFDYNIPGYLKRNGKERTKEKIRFMYNRLSKKARRTVQRMKFKNSEIKKLFKESIESK